MLSRRYRRSRFSGLLLSETRRSGDLEADLLEWEQFTGRQSAAQGNESLSKISFEILQKQCINLTGILQVLCSCLEYRWLPIF